jgi:hypothetical protein
MSLQRSPCSVFVQICNSHTVKPSMHYGCAHKQWHSLQLMMLPPQHRQIARQSKVNNIRNHRLIRFYEY